MKALIAEGRVAQVEPDENVFPVHPNFVWVDCPENCMPGWEYDGNEFIEPVPEQLSDDELRMNEMPSMNEKLDAIFEMLASNNRAKLDEVKAKIDAANAKYPRP